MHLLVIEDERALCETIVRSLRRLAYAFHFPILSYPRRSQRLRRLFWRYQIYRCNRRSRRADYSFAATKVSVIRRPSCRTLFS